MNTCENHIYVIFGASGDLTKRKLIPAIYELYVHGQLPSGFTVLGASRTQWSDQQFRDNMALAVMKYVESADNKRVKEFIRILYYEPVETESVSSFLNLKKKLQALRREKNIAGNTMFYLSTPPSLYSLIPRLLSQQGLNKQDDGWKRLIIEKPFGYDLQSAQVLHEDLMKDWTEEQIYRIDHYLGKETVQNILVTRFSNGIFEPLWNRNYIHYVEITSSEEIGVEKRGGYYDSSGALRDMIQNHLLQLLGFIAMEPPSAFDASAIRAEILKVFMALRKIKEEDVSKLAVRGQYRSSIINNESVPGYREEEGVDNESMTETYAALKIYVDNWRWGGIPFYIRTGKRLPARFTEVIIHFKPTPHFLFTNQGHHNSNNQLIIRIQPDEGINLRFGMKVPGSGFNVQNVNMDFRYSDLNDQVVMPAYVRLIFDTMNGDKTLFAKIEEVMAAWQFLMPVLNAWQNDRNIPLYGYAAGSWGPDQADDLIEEKELSWMLPQ